MVAQADTFKSRYDPLPYQEDFHRARWGYPYRWLSAGVGTGKTVAAIMEDFYYTQIFAPGKNGIILCPDYATFEQVIMSAIEKWWPPIWECRHVSGLPELRVATPTGETSKIFVRVGSNKRSVRSINGLEAAWAHVEEGGRIHEGERAFYFLEQRLREDEIIYTDASGRERRITGPVHVSGTPWPGWLVDEFRCGDGHPPTALRSGYTTDGSHWIRQARTRDNPHLPEEFIERQYAGGTDNEWAQQELEGQIVQSQGRMLHNVHRSSHVIPADEAMFMFQQCPTKDCAVDFGFDHPAALAIGGWLPGGGGTVTVKEWVHAGRDDEELGYQVWLAQRDLGVQCVYLPPEEFESRKKKWTKGFYYQDTKYRIRNVRKADNARAAGWSTMRSNAAMKRKGLVEARPGWLISEDCPNIIEQAIKLRRATDIELQMGQAKGVQKEGATMPMVDDAIDAERYRQQTGGKSSNLRGREMKR
jgi:hypothetical protein